MNRREQWVVALKACSVIGVYLACGLLLQRLTATRLAENSWWLSPPLAFAALQSALVTGLICILLAAKLRRKWKDQRTQQLAPAIRSLLSEHAAGIDRVQSLNKFCRRYQTVVEACLVELLPSIRGEGRTRLIGAADRLGLISRWKRASRSRLRRRRHFALSALGESSVPGVLDDLRAALSDPDVQIRVMAARFLARQSTEGAAEVFRYAVKAPLLVRALVADDLKKHSASLSASTLIPASATRPEVLASLEICLSWQRTIRIAGLDRWIEDSDPEIAAAAVRMLAYDSDPVRLGSRLKAALEHPAAQVRAAAAQTAGRLEASFALPQLTAGLKDPEPFVVHACVSALAALGPQAWPVLQAEVLRGTARARVATEALEAAQTGRLSAVGA